MKNNIHLMIKFVKNLYSYEFIRYSIGGGFAAILDLVVLLVCTDVLGIYYLVSAVISFVVSVSFAFLFQKYITFRNKSKKHLKQGSLFIAFQLIGQGIYMLILWLGVNIRGFYYMFVAIVGKGVAFMRNYFSNRYFNFKK